MSKTLLEVKKLEDGSVSMMFQNSNESVVELSATIAATMNNNVSFKAIIYTALSICNDKETMKDLITNTKRKI